MFDIGFSEMMVIAVMELIVIGPERLPRVARTLGHLAGRLQRYVADVKADINREIELDELRKMRDSMQQAASAFQSSVSNEVAGVQKELDKAAGELNNAAASLEKPFDKPVDKPAEPTPQASQPQEPVKSGTP